MTPESVIEQWAQCFNNGDLAGITSLYHKDSTLLPTFLSKLLTSKEQISEVSEISDESFKRNDLFCTIVLES